jgi:hypothetical protein
VMRKRKKVNATDLPATFGIDMGDGNVIMADRPSQNVMDAIVRTLHKPPSQEDMAVIKDYLEVQEEKYPSA